MKNLNTLLVLHIFSIFDKKSGIKGIVFQRLFELCERNDQLKIIVEIVKNIEEISKDWNFPSKSEDSYIEHAVKLLIKTTSLLLPSMLVLHTSSSSTSAMIKSLLPSKLRMRLRDAYYQVLKSLLLLTQLTFYN